MSPMAKAQAITIVQLFICSLPSYSYSLPNFVNSFTASIFSSHIQPYTTIRQSILAISVSGLIVPLSGLLPGLQFPETICFRPAFGYRSEVEHIHPAGFELPHPVHLDVLVMQATRSD